VASARLVSLPWRQQGWFRCHGVGEVGFVAVASARLVSLLQCWRGWFHCHSVGEVGFIATAVMVLLWCGYLLLGCWQGCFWLLGCRHGRFWHHGIGKACCHCFGWPCHCFGWHCCCFLEELL